MRKRLKEGTCARRDRRKTRVKKTVSTAYRLTAAAVYLGWSFLTGWKITWVFWPVAGVLFAPVMRLCNLFIDKEKER